MHPRVACEVAPLPCPQHCPLGNHSEMDGRDGEPLVSVFTPGGWSRAGTWMERARHYQRTF